MDMVITDSDLERLPDGELAALIARATAVRKRREAEAQRQALAQIRLLAKAHGIDLAGVSQRRRGRKPRESPS